MRRFEALADFGHYRVGRVYTFDKVPQVVANAAMVGIMREVPALSEGQVAAKTRRPRKAAKRREVVDVDDISTLESVEEKTASLIADAEADRFRAV